MSVNYHKARDCWRCVWVEKGKKRYRYFSTEDEARSFDGHLSAKKAGSKEVLTLGELMVLYFRANNIHHKTKKNIVYFLAGHERNGRHVAGAGEFLRDRFAERLNRSDLETMRSVLRKRNVSNNTINKYQAYIRSILAWGVDEQLISSNPWREFRRLKVDRPLIRTSLSDILMIYKAAPGWLQWAILTAYALSLRPGIVELFSLRWDSFFFNYGFVRFRQGKSGQLKTVYPPDWYLSLAHDRFRQDSKRGVFWVCHRDGRRVLSYVGAWRRAVKDAGLSGIRFYDIRHVAASEMLAAGADLSAVAAQLGHSTPQTTASTYIHSLPVAQRRAASLLVLPDSLSKLIDPK